MDRPILSPTILTINDCFETLSPLHKESQLRLLLRVYRIYRDITHQDESLEQFLFWGKMMLGDFSEIDNHLVPNVKELFSTIRDLKELDLRFDYLTERQRNAISEFWGDFWSKQDREEKPMSESFLFIWQLLYPIYDTLRTELLAERLAYDGLLHRHLIENWDTIDPSQLREHYVFIGFNALTASEEALLLKLRDMGRADFYFDYSQPMLRDTANRASLFMEHNRQLFPSRYTVEVECGQTAITHIAVPSTIGEAHETHRILSLLHPKQSDKTDFTRTAVVLPDERMLLNLLTAIPSSIDRVNVTMGYPLSATPVYALLKMVRSLIERQTEAGYYHKDVEAILSHKYIHAMHKEQADALLTRIREKNLIFIAPAELPFSVSDLRTLINDLPDSEELGIVDTILTQIEDVERTMPDIHFSTTTELFLLDFLLSGLTIPYTGEPLEGLQIMGVLETRALDFDNVIITSFNDEVYPGSSRGNSFVPYTLRHGFSLPTPERQDAIFAYNFYRMISYAQNVYLITNSRADDQHSGEPSRYLSQLLYQYQYPIQKVVITPGGSVTAEAQRVIHKSDAVMERLNEYTSGKRCFSPSAINSYLRCPMLFYWETLLKIRPPKQVDEQIDNADFGTLMHALMQQLYEPYIGHEVGAADILTMIEQANDPALVVQHPDWQRADELEQLVLREYATLILRQLDLPIAPFLYVAGEKKCEPCRLTLSDGRTALLYGIIDRIDRKEGVTRLVDYKSGNGETEFESIASLFDAEDDKRNAYALQTLCYALLYQSTLPSQPSTLNTQPLTLNTQPPTLNLYSVRKAATPGNTAIHLKSGEPITQDTIDEFRSSLIDLIEQILAPGDFTPTTNPRTCESCPYLPLCRK